MRMIYGRMMEMLSKGGVNVDEARLFLSAGGRVLQGVGPVWRPIKLFSALHQHA